MIATLAVPQALFARQPNLADMAYGDGVQAYFSGNHDEAQQYLATAIQNNPGDPRPHYFRGLSLLRLGRTVEARQELAAGATIEAQRPSRYLVGRSLERVQGRDRLLLEEFRRQARAELASAQSERQRVRYQPPAARDANVVRQQVAIPLEDLVEPSKLPEWTRTPAAVVSPQETAAAQEMMRVDSANAAGAETASATAASGASDDPFADDQVPTADPFAVDDQPSDTQATSGGEKIPPEKMWGIVGRVLRRAAPLPPLDGVGGKLPFMSGGPTENEAFNGAAEPIEADSPAMPADSNSPFDFGQSASDTSPEAESDPFGDAFDQPDVSGNADDGAAAAPSEPLEDDPFGGF